MCPPFTLGFERRRQGGVLRPASEVHLGDRDLCARDERMGVAEHARALAQRLLEVGAAFTSPADARLEKAFELERLCIAIGVVAGARLVERRHGLVSQSRGDSRLAGLPGHGSKAGEGPCDLRVRGPESTPSHHEYLLVHSPRIVEPALGGGHVRQAIEAACDERVVGTKSLRPHVHRRLIQALRFRPVAHFGGDTCLVEGCGGADGLIR
jgi:hypothetical protein